MESRFIGAEEKSMEETFGDAYREYKARVRRWI
jgi:protein-S-isoprenylcysteine O-methyltransferase Ste14